MTEKTPASVPKADTSKQQQSTEHSHDAPENTDKKKNTKNDGVPKEKSHTSEVANENEKQASEKGPADDEEVEEEEEEKEEEEENKDAEVTKSETPVKKKFKGLLEYDLSDMYPELSTLTQTQKRNWNFSDPELIRAIWLETKTNALAKWKMKYSKIIKKKDPSIPVQINHAMQLRKEYRQAQKEREKEQMLIEHEIGKDAPQFNELRLPTTITAQMRYRLNRDNPPVPESYIRHFAKYRKPPFLNKAVPGLKCKPK